MLLRGEGQEREHREDQLGQNIVVRGNSKRSLYMFLHTWAQTCTENVNKYVSRRIQNTLFKQLNS